MKAPRWNSTETIGTASAISAVAAGIDSSIEICSAWFWLASASLSRPPLRWRLSSGKSTVPTAMPMIPSGNWYSRSA